MSHSDNLNDQYLELYKLQRSTVASALHSKLAQPIVAAKNFAAAIINIQGKDKNLQEARDLAGVILEMTDQAYTVAYDLMRENESRVITEPNESMQSHIENQGKFLRLNSRGIKLQVCEDLSSILMDDFIQTIVLDWVKSFLIYLARHTKVSVVSIELMADNLGFNLEIKSNVVLSSEHLDTETGIFNIRKQLQVLTGTLLVSNATNESYIRILIPQTCEMLNVIKCQKST